jgi:hypothetical protein
MIGTIDGGGSPLADHVLYAVPGKRGTYERIARHAANLIPQTDGGKRYTRANLRTFELTHLLLNP